MKFFRSIFTVLALSISISAAYSVAEPAAESMGKELFLNQDDLRWENAPPSLPKGAKVAVLFGDPAKPGPFVMRIMTPDDYRIRPHYHSQAESLTIISGTFYLGDGKKFEPAKAHALHAGGFHYLPAKSPHFAFSKTPTIVQVYGEGPFDTIYINPGDDPRKTR